ncbi:MAG: agmatinase [Proteobacteria bacterium]|nr:agmatinase [Pseudomonadota bacterium]
MAFMAPEEGFLGLTGKDAFMPEKAKAWVIPFGLEASVSYGSGTVAGPQAIIDASRQVELFDELFWKEAFRDYGVATMEAIKIAKKIPKALEQIDALVEETLLAGKFPLVLGGEHSITPGAIRPFIRRGQKITLLHFDAHADLRDGYDGEKHSHAAALRRCLDYDQVRLVSVGIRNISAGEIPFLEANRKRIEIFWGKDRGRWTAADVAKAVGGGAVYITFDLDGFDGSVMPATGTPEPGGLFWSDVMDIFDSVSALPGMNFVGADVVELAPVPGFHACDFLAARLAYRMLSYAMGLRPPAAK